MFFLKSIHRFAFIFSISKIKRMTERSRMLDTRGVINMCTFKQKNENTNNFIYVLKLN